MATSEELECVAIAVAFILHVTIRHRTVNFLLLRKHYIRFSFTLQSRK